MKKYWHYDHRGKDLPLEEMPTGFCQSMAKELGILVPSEKYSIYSEQLEILKMFQLMSVMCEFEDSMFLFHDLNLSQEQINGLIKIRRSTRNWMKGYLVTKCIDRMKNSDADPQEVNDVAKVCLELLASTAKADELN